MRCTPARDDRVGEVGERRVGRRRACSACSAVVSTGSPPPTIVRSPRERAVAQRRASVTARVSNRWSGAEHRERGGRDEELLRRRARERRVAVDARRPGRRRRRPSTQPRTARRSPASARWSVAAATAATNSAGHPAGRPQRRRERAASDAAPAAAARLGVGAGAEHAGTPRPRSRAPRRSASARRRAQASPRVWRKRAYRHRCPSAVTARFADA